MLRYCFFLITVCVGLGTPYAKASPPEATIVDVYGADTNAPLSTQDKDIWLDKAETFMNGIRTLKAKFVQVTSHQNGIIDSRTGFLKWMRPAYIRFDYEGNPLLKVVCDGESFRQKDEDGVSLSVALESTPAGLILKNNLRFKKDAVIKNMAESGTFVLLTLATKEDPEGATLTLVFKKSPFSLAQWTTVDTTGRIIDVVLTDIQIGLPMTKNEFKLD